MTPDATSEPQTIQEAAVAAATTIYVVLKEGPVGAWKDIATVKARDGNSAIRATIAGLDETDQAGTFVAVPSRSWKPVRVSAKVERTIVVEDA